METAEQILLRHFGCKNKDQLMIRCGINFTDIDIIKRAMEVFAQQQAKYVDLSDVVGRIEQLVAFLKWVGDGYDFEDNAEKIVKQYIDEGN